MDTKSETNSDVIATESSGQQPSKHWVAPNLFLLSDIVKKTDASGPNAGTVDGTYSFNV